MKEYLSFDDVLISPQFSIVKSRKDVDTTSFGLSVPIISSNMDTVTGPKMVKAMTESGGAGCLHRFCNIEDNVKMFHEAREMITINHGDGTYTNTQANPWVSIGLGRYELERAEALFNAGADTFVIDVAHGAAMEVANQFDALNEIISAKIIVGNFANAISIRDFIYNCNSMPYAFKVGIGGGSACTTRMVTGCGIPTLGSIRDCANMGAPIIADGGIRNSGDFCKALAAGASAVMMGRLFAGCDESPGTKYIEHCGTLYSADKDINDFVLPHIVRYVKEYRGSASAESYAVQNKVSEWRTAEGEAYTIPYTGPVKDIMKQFEAGLRSAMAYVGAYTVEEFKERAELVRVTNGGALESTPHGKIGK